MAASEKTSDILMMFNLAKNAPIAGYSTSQLVTPGKLRSVLVDGFKPGGIMEIDSFSFAMGLTDDSDDGQDDANRPDARTKAEAAALRQGFRAWRTGEIKKYPVNVQPTSITRPVDGSSNILFQNCIDCTTFESAAIIKRKAAGSAVSGEVYLRIDFQGVLITNIEWSNEDPVKETFEFISRAITVRYRPQLASGALDVVRAGSWSMP